MVAAESTTFYITNDKETLAINDKLRCLLGIYGTFADDDHKPTAPTDTALLRLEKAQLIPKDADIMIVFEAAVMPSMDNTAMYLDTRHFSVRDFIGDRKKNDRVYIATLNITMPNASAEGDTIALGNIDLGRMPRENLPIGDPGGFPHYRSNLMPWKQITEQSMDTYKADVKQDAARNKAYMPVTLTLTLSETADGNKFLVTLGDLLEASKADVASELGKDILPEERQKAAQEAELSAEKLYAAEEDAHIAVLNAQAAFTDAKNPTASQKAVLQAELEKATRAYNRAVKLRKAAGLPDQD